jgi:hypothetical protein
MQTSGVNHPSVISQVCDLSQVARPFERSSWRSEELRRVGTAPSKLSEQQSSKELPSRFSLLLIKQLSYCHVFTICQHLPPIDPVTGKRSPSPIKKSLRFRDQM